MIEQKIFAVVVSYKRANLLKECLNAVLNLSTYKVYQLHLVINSLEESSMKVIKRFIDENQGVISYEIHDNCGPAGGFYFGLKKFLNSNTDYAWLMDDDVVPQANCLEELMKCSKYKPYILPKTYKSNGEQVVSFGWWGVLLSKKVVEKAGLPIKDFFYWTEDTEYLQNRMIREHKIIPHRCEKARVAHLHERDAYKPDWFYYYTIRNTLYYRSRIFPINYKGFIRLGNLFFGSGYRILFKEKNKLRKAYYMILGCSHALQGKLGKLNIDH